MAWKITIQHKQKPGIFYDTFETEAQLDSWFNKEVKRNPTWVDRWINELNLSQEQKDNALATRTSPDNPEQLEYKIAADYTVTKENVGDTPLWQEIRKQRDALLKDSDKAVMPDSPLTSTSLQEWKNYRQQLRDLPNTISNPNSFSWPQKPSWVTE